MKQRAFDSVLWKVALAFLAIGLLALACVGCGGRRCHTFPVAWTDYAEDGSIIGTREVMIQQCQ